MCNINHRVHVYVSIELFLFIELIFVLSSAQSRLFQCVSLLPRQHGLGLLTTRSEPPKATALLIHKPSVMHSTHLRYCTDQKSLCTVHALYQFAVKSITTLQNDNCIFFPAPSVCTIFTADQASLLHILQIIYNILSPYLLHI